VVATGSSSAHRKLSGFGQSPDRAVPPLGVALALVEIRDQQVRDAVPAVVRDQRPLGVGFVGRQRVVRAEQPPELAAEPRLAGQSGGQRAEGATQHLLHRP
jgi:hypothetical protein